MKTVKVIVGALLEYYPMTTTYCLLMLLALTLVSCFAGCTTAPTHQLSAPVRTDTIEVPRYIAQPVAPELTTPILVAKPAADCNDGVSPVMCGKTLKLYRLELEKALTTCNDDRAAIRNGTPVSAGPGG